MKRLDGNSQAGKLIKKNFKKCLKIITVMYGQIILLSENSCYLAKIMVQGMEYSLTS